MIHKLIAKDVKPPVQKPKLRYVAKREYVLVYDHPARARGANIQVKRGTVVTHVRKNPYGLYCFIVKATGKQYESTWFPGQFALNTPENLLRLQAARNIRAAYFKFKREMRLAFKQVQMVGEE